MSGGKRTIRGRLPRLYRQQQAQLTLEWTLLLAAVALPMYWVFRVCLSVLTAHFRMVTFMETVPFP